MTQTRKMGSWLALFGSALAATALLYYADRLRIAESRATQIIDNTPVGIMVCDVDGKAVRVNPAMAKISGFTETELITGGETLLIPEAYKTLHNNAIATLSKHIAAVGLKPGEVSYTKILPVSCKDGRQISAAVSVSTVRNGTQIEFFAFVTPLPDVPLALSFAR